MLHLQGFEFYLQYVPAFSSLALSAPPPELSLSRMLLYSLDGLDSCHHSAEINFNAKNLVAMRSHIFFH